MKKLKKYFNHDHDIVSRPQKPKQLFSQSYTFPNGEENVVL